ncbi:MAG: hypothetical protein WCK78_16920 [Paludibacter sp.]
MDKRYLLLVLMILGVYGFSQSIVLFYNGKQLTDKQTIYLDSIDANFGYIKAIIGIKNISDAEIEVNVSKKPITVIDNSSNLFCWGIYCYSPSVNDSRNAVKIPSKTINESFYAEYVPSDVPSGETVIEYKFYEVTNTSNSASVVVHFVEKNRTGLNELQMGEYFTLSSIKNTKTTQVSYNLTSNSNLIVQNVSGQIIGKFLLPLGAATINLPTYLNKGLFICSIVRLNGIVINKKLLNY